MLLLNLIYFMLPAYFANMVPVFARKHLEFLNVPLDLGKKFRGKQILGSHKTLRGLLLGILAGVIIAGLQFLLVPYTGSLIMYDYSNWPLLGFLLAFGALFGDSVKSFFKRQAGIKSGKSWIPFDQIDYAIGAVVFVSFLTFPGWSNSLLIILISFALHFIVNAIGYFLKIRNQIW